ncbi:MAG: shikimate dehydrogenase [Proteobacteria bacterium]|nr:shikimate dehydrogenase [Pseudomonadota bacterium]
MSKKYTLALFGHPVKHSLSPQIHQQFARQFALDIDYQLLDVENEDFLPAVIKFFHAGGHGANVTLPYKQDACAIVNTASQMAKLSGAVNTLFLNDNLAINGDNTDGYGLVIDLNNRCKFLCHKQKVLILGAGGATQGIVPAILTQQPESIIIANRSIEKAQKIARFKYTQAITLEQLDELNQAFDLIIHASSLGHQGKTLQFKSQHIHENTLCYDLSYAKAALPFLQFSHAMGVNKTFDGVGMLIEQAAKSFEIWFDKKPNTNGVVLLSSSESI